MSSSNIIIGIRKLSMKSKAGHNKSVVYPTHGRHILIRNKRDAGKKAEWALSKFCTLLKSMVPPGIIISRVQYP